jgi:hypothetical protein
LIISDHGSDMARRPPVGQRCINVYKRLTTLGAMEEGRAQETSVLDPHCLQPLTYTKGQRQTPDWLIDYYGVRLRLWTAATGGHTVHPPDDMSVERDGGMILTGKNGRTRRKTCLGATLSPTNPTWIHLCANPYLRSERPETNCLIHGTARDTPRA